MSQLGNLSPEGSVAIGVIVCLLSSGIQSLGLTLQRKSHMLEESRYLDGPRPPYRRRRWQVGFSLFLIANLVGSTIQLSILPLPVLAALQAAGLVFNSINATTILGEAFTRWSLLGTVLVSAGALLIAYFGALPEPAHSLDQLLALFARKQFIAWAVVQLLLLFLVFGIIYLMRRLSPSRGTSRKMRLARGMCYGALSGMLSAHSLLMAKSAVELLVRTIADRDNQFSHWESWIILVALISIGLSQLYCLHSGLQLCSTSVLYPFVFCVYNVITILDGLIYFNQSSQLGPLEDGLIVLGTLILLAGVFCLSWRLAADDMSGPQPPEISENPLTPPVGVIGTSVTSPRDARERLRDERQPLLSRSPATTSPVSPYVFRPRRASMRSKNGDEEAQIGPGTDFGYGHGPDDEPTRALKLSKTRKRATFADFGTMGSLTGRTRSLTNPSPYGARRSSVLSMYATSKSKRMNDQDRRALWGELEEAGSPLGGVVMARSEILSARLPDTQNFGPISGSWRRMSEGSGQLLGGGRRRLVTLPRPARRASDTGGIGGDNIRQGSAGSGVKHGDPGQAVEEDDEQEAMASSVPLLQRAGTGRTYRVFSPDMRRRQSSGTGGERPSTEARRRWLEEDDHGGGQWEWHTIDSSNGRPSDDDEEAAAPARTQVQTWNWNSWKQWITRRGQDDEGDVER